MKENKKLTIIVQAGGRGSRLRHHTWNKPKCLVSVKGKPIIYHAFELFNDCHFIIIGDYLFGQIDKYLKVNPPGVSYELVQTDKKGTIAGIKDALKLINKNDPVLIIWSDLIIGELPKFSKVNKNPLIAITSNFTCRWSVSKENKLIEKPASENGIPGIFYFPTIKRLNEIPDTGEFVRWLSDSKMDFDTININSLNELGDFSTIEDGNDRAGFCRFFNHVDIGSELVTKKVIDSNFSEVHENEKKWYKEVQSFGFRRIPQILSYEPLTMMKINGKHIFELTDLNQREQRSVFADYIDSLQDLHDKVRVPVKRDEISEVYINKTLKRVESIFEIVPHTEKSHMTINGKKCRNFFHEKNRHIFSDLIPKITPEHFCSIHGDPTFSNTIVDDKLRVWYIDPRGYFHKPGVVGDGWYDYAKFYYSSIGSYDAFNRKKFKLHVDDDTVEILIEEPKYSNSALCILKDYFGPDMIRIELIHGLIWLSLSGYVKDDIDSIIGSYYYGNYWLENALDKI